MVTVALMPGSGDQRTGETELNCRFIANAIADLGFTGYVAHEWRPSPGHDPVKSLEECFEIMNV